MVGVLFAGLIQLQEAYWSVAGGIMKRQYVKLMFERVNDKLDIEEAISIGSYVKTYFLDEHTIGRVDTYLEGIGLCNISYREVMPPFDELVRAHFTNYPANDVMCECFTPESVTPEGLRVAMLSYYTAPDVLDFQAEVYMEKNGRVVKRIYVDEDGRPIREEHPIYDYQGELIGRKFYGPTGQFLYEDDYSDKD
jgi:hypothetical protein